VVAIDDGNGCVEPTPETIDNGTYAPLTRPLFVYVNAEALEKPEVKAFMEFYLQNAPSLVAEVGYRPLSAEIYAEALNRLQAGDTTPIELDNAHSG